MNGADEYKTPTLDRLAEQGMRFTNAFSNPVCTPSRVKLITGKSNIRNYVAFARLDRGERTFAHILKQAGYATAIAGKWQLGSEADAPQHFGFDQALLWQHTRPRTKAGTEFDSRNSQPWFELNGVEVNYGEGVFGPDVMSDFIKANKQRPFIAYYPMLLTHCPFVPTPDSPDWDPAPTS